MINFENLDKLSFHGVGKYGIPQIEPVYTVPEGEFIPINLISAERHPEDKVAHCFVDDYRFIRHWNAPDRYIPRLSELAAVCAPDFSLYTDMPLAMQIYNHYRKHWLAAYWQRHGLTVYPSVSWSDERSFEWCFDGEPAESVVAVSSVGTQRSREGRRLFMRGYEEMMKRLEPSAVIFYGEAPEGCGFEGRSLRIEPYYGELAGRREKERG